MGFLGAVRTVGTMLFTRNKPRARAPHEEQDEKKHHVKIRLDRAASRYVFDWSLVDTKVRRFTKEERERLDQQVALYARHYADEHPQLGEHQIEMWF